MAQSGRAGSMIRLSELSIAVVHSHGHLLFAGRDVAVIDVPATAWPLCIVTADGRSVKFIVNQ